MAEAVAEIPQPEVEKTTTTMEENMELDENNTNGAKPNGGEGKRPRDDTNGGTEVEGEDANNKKQKVEKSVEEERLDELQKEGEGDDVEAEEEKKGPVSLGPKEFGSSVEMFDYLYKFVHYWPMNLNINKYEHMVLLDLLKKGHPEPEKKIGAGAHAFQVRSHPMWKSRCFFIVREDETVDDFSFRKCIDSILPLPEEMKGNQHANKALGGPGGGRGGGGHGGRGGGGRGGRGWGGRRGGNNRGRGSRN